MPNPATVPMFDPDGVLRDIPYEQMTAAVAAGGKTAVKFQAPDNTTRYVPADQYRDAEQAGGKILPLEQQDVQHEGFWKSLGSDVWNMVKSAPSLLPPVQAYQGIKKGAEEYQSVKSTGKTTEQNESDQQTKAGYSSAYRHVATPLAQGIGVNVPGMEQSAAEGDIAGVAGHAAAVPAVMAATEGVSRALPVAAAKLPAVSQSLENIASKTPIVKSFIDGPPHDLVTRAVKPGKNNVGWNADVQSALPNIKAAEEQLGRPIGGLDDALEATTLAKKNLWKQYSARLGSASEIGAQIDGNPVADAMVNSIDKRTAAQNPGLVAKVNKVADTYRRPLGMDEAEDFLQSANKDLNSYYAKNKVGRQVALNDPEMSSTVAEGEALRSALYGKLDEVSGPGAADLKKQYGALTNIEKEMTGRQNVAARQQPQSLSEQIGTVRGYGKMARGVLTGSPGQFIEGAQGIATAKWLKDRNSTDAMIQRAFSKTQPAQPAPPPMMPMIRGQLKAAPIELGNGPDRSGSTPYTPPPVANTTRAERLGLLLKEPSPELPAPGYTEPLGEPIGTPVGSKPQAFEQPQGMAPGTKLGQLKEFDGENFLWTGSRWIRASQRNIAYGSR